MLLTVRSFCKPPSPGVQAMCREVCCWNSDFCTIFMHHKSYIWYINISIYYMFVVREQMYLKHVNNLLIVQCQLHCSARVLAMKQMNCVYMYLYAHMYMVWMCTVGIYNKWFILKLTWIIETSVFLKQACFAEYN